MGKTKGLRMRHPLAYDQVKLCDLTLDIESPWNDCREFPDKLDEKDIFPVDELNLEAIQSQVREANAQAQLAAFLGAQANFASKAIQRESVGRARCYRIRNSGDKFKQACKNPKVKEWLTEYHIKSGLPVYMIVGLYTYEKAQVGEAEITTVGVSGKGGSGGIRGEGQIRSEGQHATIFTTASESIFAMEYRKLKKQWLSKNIDKAVLEQGNRWEVFWGMRSKLDKESGDDQRLVEVELTDEGAEDVDNPETLFDADDYED
jgi:hypothetical protein